LRCSVFISPPLIHFSNAWKHPDTGSVLTERSDFRT
jgi:hypothetical protein